MGRPGRWFVIAGLLAVIGLAVGGVAIFSGNSSPRGYVQRHFSRAASRDNGTAMAFTSTQAPSLVAQQVRGAWKPANDYADATGVYLRYARDAVTIFPLATGSLIMVEESSRAYRRYYSTVGSSWGYTAGRGESVRGGGPGAGK